MCIEISIALEFFDNTDIPKPHPCSHCSIHGRIPGHQNRFDDRALDDMSLVNVYLIYSILGQIHPGVISL